jgi:hypothetical protein
VVASTTTLLRRGFVLAAFLVVAGLAAVVIALILAGSGGRGDVELRLGDDVFVAGRAEPLAGTVDRHGPILVADASPRLDRDIYVQHLGDDPATGWSAFAARPDGTSRDCTLVWEPVAARFTSPCDGATFPADGAGLRQYAATVDDDRDVVVDLREPAPVP